MLDTPDAAAQGALAQSVIRPAWLAFIDIAGDPIRVTTAPYDVALTNTGDMDIDGFTFSAIDASLVSVSPIQRREGGASTVTASLSGLMGVDSDTLNQLGDPANWRGRPVRLWAMMLDADAKRIGSVWEWYSGMMTAAPITGDADGQVVTLSIESYLGFLAEASNHTYLDQTDIDPSDMSAEATLACANGTNGTATGGLAALAAGGGIGAIANQFTQLV